MEGVGLTQATDVEIFVHAVGQGTGEEGNCKAGLPHVEITFALCVEIVGIKEAEGPDESKGEDKV